MNKIIPTIDILKQLRQGWIVWWNKVGSLFQHKLDQRGCDSILCQGFVGGSFLPELLKLFCRLDTKQIQEPVVSSLEDVITNEAIDKTKVKVGK